MTLDLCSGSPEKHSNAQHSWDNMTTTELIAGMFGGVLVVWGLLTVRMPGGLAMGACGAIILGMTYAGAFNF